MNSKILDMDYTVGEVELTYKSTSKSRNKIYSSEDAYEVLLSTYREGTICYKEYFKVLFLNQAKQVLGYTLISEGGITDTTVYSRRSFTVMRNCAPDPEPSITRTTVSPAAKGCTLIRL